MDSTVFDWYISPSSKFTYEQQFSRYISDNDINHVTIQDLEPLFNQSHLPSDQFLQMWAIVDIWLTNKLNKEQFIYFSHVLSERRKGKVLPVGLPLHIKESFLRAEDKINPSNMFSIIKTPSTNDSDGINPNLGYNDPSLGPLSASSSGSSSTIQPFVRSISVSASRDLGASLTKNVKELEIELSQLSKEISSCEVESRLAKDRVDSLDLDNKELLEWKQFEEKVKFNVETISELSKSSPSSLTLGSVADKLTKLNNDTKSSLNTNSNNNTHVSKSELDDVQRKLLIQQESLNSLLSRINLEKSFVTSLSG